MFSFTDDPARDAERYFEEQEALWNEENDTKHCEICGRPCAREKHYEFEDVTVCEKCVVIAFKRMIIPSDVLEEMINEYEVRP